MCNKLHKREARFGNWNVQGLNAPGKIDVRTEECDLYKINLDFVALIELHWPGQDKIRHDGWEIIYSGPDSNKKECIVGLMIFQAAAKFLLSYECISDRLMVANSIVGTLSSPW